MLSLCKLKSPSLKPFRYRWRYVYYTNYMYYSFLLNSKNSFPPGDPDVFYENEISRKLKWSVVHFEV